MTAKAPKRLDIEPEAIREIVRQSHKRALTDEEHSVLEALLETTLWLTEELQAQRLSAKRLYRMLFGPSSEKTKVVLSNDDNEGAGEGDDSDESAEADRDSDVESNAHDDGDGDRAKGHGRLPAAAYRGADKVCVSHESLKPGQRCPACARGKLYPLPPRVIVRVTGAAPLGAKVYECERLRCGSCGQIFAARPPPDARSPKYDEAAAAMVALLRYGYGLPHNRLAKLQHNLGIPLPASTQWKVIKGAADDGLEPAYDELVRQAAQGTILHNDDTKMPVLALTGERRAKEAPADDPVERTGMFTTAIASVIEGRHVALYVTGRRHAGENLSKLFANRDTPRQPPIQMCDGLSRNIPKDYVTILANCMAHARRHFVDVADNFPRECAYVFDKLAEVFVNDAHCRKEQLSDEERLAYHIEHSQAVMEELAAWFDAQFEEKRVEPNSGLGQAFEYMRKRWDALTLFLRKPGAPLDNNLVERILKRAIVHRKNSLFYRSIEGARIGDMYMSLIHTAELCGADVLDYLVALMRHADAVAAAPAAWMPWNYTETRAGMLDHAAE